MRNNPHSSCDRSPTTPFSLSNVALRGCLHIILECVLGHLFLFNLFFCPLSNFCPYSLHKQCNGRLWISLYQTGNQSTCIFSKQMHNILYIEGWQGYLMRIRFKKESTEYVIRVKIQYKAHSVNPTRYLFNLIRPFDSNRCKFSMAQPHNRLVIILANAHTQH